MNNKIRIISSSDLITGYTYNGNIKLKNTINGIYKILEFYLTNSLYNVNSNNNKVYFNESSVLKTATLTNGYYSSSELATQLQTAMNLAGGNTYTITLDTK